MNRWLWFSGCVIVSVMTYICGWMIPAHLRAVDASVIRRAGMGSRTLVTEGVEMVNRGHANATRLLLDAARTEVVPDREKLATAIATATQQRPARQGTNGVEPFTEFVIRLENRTKVLDLLRASTKPGVQELLRCRNLTNTVIFPPSQSAAGQAFDAAICIGGLLLHEDRLTPELVGALHKLASGANGGGNSQMLEQTLGEFMSLGQRMDGEQLAVFVANIKDPETLRQLSGFIRKNETNLPVIFSAVHLSGNPEGVARYLTDFSRTGFRDLGSSLRYGVGGVNALLQRNQQMAVSSLREKMGRQGMLAGYFDLALDYCWRNMQIAVTVKWLLYLAAGFFIAWAVHFVLPRASVLERPLEVRGFHFAREILFALGFLLVVLLLSEPFLSQESQKAEMPFRLRLPTPGSAALAVTPGAIAKSIMNQESLMTMLLFFVLQALIYIACLLKLAEIRRQRVSSAMKLKLLKNEEHLFDAGLYLGFAGTIVSLVLVSMGVFKQPSLMAAYSATAFGILFVCVFKIFHLRPTSRRLLLETDAAATAESRAQAAGRTYAGTPS